MRFRRSFKVCPGFRINVSGSGLSSSVGIKGASVTFSKRGTYLNTGIPGTGIYNREKISSGKYSDYDSGYNFNNETFGQSTVPSEEYLINISSQKIDALSSSNFNELKDSLINTYNQRKELSIEVQNAKKIFKKALNQYWGLRLILIGFFIKKLKTNLDKALDNLNEIENQFENCFTDIDFTFNDSFNIEYNKFLSSYKMLIENTSLIWDITKSKHFLNQQYLVGDDTTIKREAVMFTLDNIDMIKSKHVAFHLANKNGGDIYIYPAFVLITDHAAEIAIIDIKDIKLDFGSIEFKETENIPSDSNIVGNTWAYINKNGQPDKRYKGNYEIPLVQYAIFKFQSKSGLNEMYCLSNFKIASEFSKKFSDFQKSF